MDKFTPFARFKPTLNQMLLFMTLAFVASTSYCIDARVAEKSDNSAPDVNAKVETVEVHGVKDPQWKPYRTMLKGLDAFDKYRSLAPQADLLFELKPQVAAIAIGDVSIHIEGKTTSIPIAVSANGTFDIPRNQSAAEDDAEMILNQKKNSVLWSPYIRTPSISTYSRRLGDMRLECEILWAVEQDDLPFLMRNTFRLAGGLCKSSHIGVTFHLPARVVAVTMVSNGKKKSLPIEYGGKGFTPPLYDEEWDNDTLIEFEFSDRGIEGNASLQ